MRRIVNGKVYDTEKAEEIGYYRNGRGRSDFRWIEESLYVTSKGNFFLAGAGGALTRYAEPRYKGGSLRDGGMGEGEGIIPLSKEEALSWCEENLDIEDYQEYFKDIMEDA